MLIMCCVRSLYRQSFHCKLKSDIAFRVHVNLQRYPNIVILTVCRQTHINRHKYHKSKQVLATISKRVTRVNNI